MSLRHAILVHLINQEASGYDLARQFADSIGLVWNATHQQIYLELGKLRELEMVQFRHQPQEGRPDKKLYSSTELGREELHRWLKKPVGPPRMRDPLLVKIFGGSQADSRTLLADLEKAAAYRRERLATFEAMARQLNEKGVGENLYTYLTVRRGILEQRSWLRWAEEVRMALDGTLVNDTAQ